jgi:hypothetical protein
MVTGFARTDQAAIRLRGKRGDAALVSAVSQPDFILSSSTPTTAALLQQTRIIPVTVR